MSEVKPRPRRRSAPGDVSLHRGDAHRMGFHRSSGSLARFRCDGTRPAEQDAVAKEDEPGAAVHQPFEPEVAHLLISWAWR